jgi:2-polyprenyl-6-methoxyphenol hydroxylase-like FAD-dependent oxidoreductase
LVEKAGALRDGGYPIDIRGTAAEVVRRMGMMPQLRDAHSDSRRRTFLDADGSEVASLHPSAVVGSVEGQDLEVRRGDLAALLHAVPVRPRGTVPPLPRLLLRPVHHAEHLLALPRDLVAQTFADAGGEVPGLVDAMRDADDLFFDTAGQIRMPHWSTGRVVLVGDAAYAPSFRTGQGSSLALVGAYTLADALAGRRDHAEAFAAHERAFASS